MNKIKIKSLFYKSKFNKKKSNLLKKKSFN